MSSDRSDRLETQVVHAGALTIEGAITTPIFQSSTYALPPIDSGALDYDDIRYLRLNNTPNHETLSRRVAAIEQTEDAVVAASGMAAITATLASVLRRGDHALIQRGIYGGSFSFIETWFERLGIEWSLMEPNDPSQWQEALQPNSKAIYMETITNPTIRVANVAAAATFANANGLLSIIDNTFASPVNCRPATFGFDIVIESATKYLNGHSDIVCGVVAGSRDLVDHARHELNLLGGSLDPHACFLLERGLKTLPLRVRQQNQNALALARYLDARDDVATVWYPGLETHPDHALAAELFDGFGGMLSFEFNDPASTVPFVSGCNVATYAPSLGGVETLIVLPSTTSHASLTAEQRATLGISDHLIRVSVGIEHIDDLKADFDQ